MYVLAIGLALLATAFFAAAEMAFIAANRARMRQLAQTGSVTAERYLQSFRQPERVLSAALMGVTIAHVIAASLATWALIPVLANTAWLVATAVLIPLMLIVGEVIPKAIARAWATALMRRGGFRAIEVGGVALSPLTRAAGAVVAGILTLFGRRPPSTRQFVSREELKLLLQMEPEEADVTIHEAEMIDNIFGLGERIVREVMVPLVDVAALPETATPEHAVRLIRERGFSRIPVYSDRVLSVVGVVTAMDLLRRGAIAPDLKALMRPTMYVPETKRLDDLLREMQKARVQLAVVVDEYGGAVGVVTVEDIVEQIVGAIEDEHDRAPATVDRLPDGSYRVAGRVRHEELNEMLDWDLPTGDFETVAGLVVATLRRIPIVGEEFAVGGYVFTVLEADSRRVLIVRITRPGAGTTSAAGAALHASPAVSPQPDSPQPKEA
jgi:putative hemolysin